MPSGWTTAGVLAAGDVLLSPSGRPSVVACVGTVAQASYDIALADGTHVLSADARIDVSVGSGPTRRLERLTPEELQTLLHSGVQLRAQSSRPLPMPSNDLPLDPYLMGVLLGDGYLRAGSVEICNEQEELHELVRAAIPAGTRLTPPRIRQRVTYVALVGDDPRFNPATRAVRELGLTGKRAWEKFVPETYLNACELDRHSLLQGLMDTDGSIDAQGRMEFSTASAALADGVVDIINSLGGRTSRSIRRGVMYTSPFQSTRTPARNSHRLTNIRLDDLPPFRLQRKASRVRGRRPGRQWTVKAIRCLSGELAATIRFSGDDGRVVTSAYTSLSAANM
jgi:hypothetical protein